MTTLDSTKPDHPHVSSGVVLGLASFRSYYHAFPVNNVLEVRSESLSMQMMQLLIMFLETGANCMRSSVVV